MKDEQRCANQREFADGTSTIARFSLKYPPPEHRLPFDARRSSSTSSSARVWRPFLGQSIGSSRGDFISVLNLPSSLSYNANLFITHISPIEASLPSWRDLPTLLVIVLSKATCLALQYASVFRHYRYRSLGFIRRAISRSRADRIDGARGCPLPACNYCRNPSKAVRMASAIAASASFACGIPNAVC